jgi:hypothetical protein
MSQHHVHESVANHQSLVEVQDREINKGDALLFVTEADPDKVK